MEFSSLGVTAALLVLSAGEVVDLRPYDASQAPQTVAVFLDGTANDRSSRTNVARLHEMTVHQDREDLVAYYSEGVGTGARFVGAVTGMAGMLAPGEVERSFGSHGTIEEVGRWRGHGVIAATATYLITLHGESL